MSSRPVDEKAIFRVASNIDSNTARDEYLHQVCGDDSRLLDRVARLVEMQAEDPEFLESPAAGASPTLDLAIVERPGAVIGPYKLLQVIGEGGMGIVYMAEQSEPVKRRVALKIIKPGMDTGQVIARFEAERQALAMMDHPNIAKVFDAGATESGRPYFVMELVKGVSITDYCDEQHFAIDERLQLFVTVCNAVQHAHQKGIIHRDIKPSNILVAEYDQQAVPKVIDFGVAKATSQKLTEKTMFTHYGQIVGTLEYMSPEQAKLNQLDIDTRSDVYSLGVLLYQLLTGATPLERERLQAAAFEEMLRIIREEDPPKPSTRVSTAGKSAVTVSGHRRTTPEKLHQFIRGELDWVVMKALEKDRGQRYESASGLGADIERFLSDETVQACPPSTVYRLRKFVKKYKAATATAALVAFAVVLGLLGTGWQALRATVAERLADEKRAVAERESKRAIQSERKAHRAAERADNQSRQLERQLLISQATGLAAQSQSVMPRAPVAALLLATEAVDLTWRRSRTVTPPAHEALLNGLLTVGGQPLPGHDRAADLVRISPDGRWLVTAASRTFGIRSEILLWDLTAKEPWATARPLKGHQEAVDDLKISSDSHWLATNSLRDSNVLLWDLTAADPTSSPKLLEGHSADVTGLAFSPDSRLLVTGSADGTARIWDVLPDDPAASVTLPDYGGDIYRDPIPTITPDGRWLVQPGADGLVHLWELNGATPKGPIKLGATQHSRLAVVSSDSQWLAMSKGWTDEGRIVTLWDLSAEDPSKALTVLDTQHGPVTALKFSPDAGWLATSSSDGTAHLWNLGSSDPASSPVVLRGHEASIHGLSISSDGRWLATGSDDQTARLWDLSNRDPASSSRTLWGHARRIRVADFTPDNKWVVTGSGDGTARLWRLDAENLAMSSSILRAHNESPFACQSVTIDPTGRWLVTHGNLENKDAVPRLWDLTAAEPARSPLTLPTQGVVGILAVSGNGRWLLAAGSEGARVWDISGSEPPNEPAADLPHSAKWENAAAIDAASRWLATVDGKVVHLWNLRSDGRFSSSTRLEHRSPVKKIMFSRNGRLMTHAHSVEQGQPSELRIWELSGDAPRLKTTIPIPVYEWMIGAQNSAVSPFGSAISPDGKWLAIGDRTTFSLWDLQRANPPRQEIWRTPQAKRGGYHAIAISPNSRWLVICGNNGILRVAELGETGIVGDVSEVVNSQSGNYTDIARVATWSRDSRFLVTANDAGIAQVWEFDGGIPSTPTYQLTGEFARRVSSGALSPTARWLATGGDGETRLWDLAAKDPGSSSVVLRHTGGRHVCFTPDGRWVVTAGRDVRLWDLNIDSLIQRARTLAGRRLTDVEKSQYFPRELRHKL